ncbi:Putative Complex: FZO1 of S. cerevisiae is part of a larger protein complex of 800 kDa [Aspergillus calidoustus]|uniref:Putative Complex: FZO1 of S. cerevisiae is part of a larger protein complex of 800 kDa n=1 Tax=Aspergillus calidoustus TaxID=454130 RepID=A0A0U5G217_ASPCI|nr:Putative Complex: FZO1 of S. cerevisiae is part of a larger protein complex of 800 kDa [Aspergillus calidoustus]
MSQEYFPGKGGSSAGEGPSRQPPDELPEQSPFAPRPPPAYMTVGNGSTSESATALMSSLHTDSGYGGSVADGASSADWRSDMLVDRPTPAHTPTQQGEWNPAAEHEKQVVASHVHQLLYNSNRTKLARAISRTIETLRELQDMNRQWPAHYPSVQNFPDSPSQRPSLQQSQSYFGDATHPDDPRPGNLRRAATMPSKEDLAESSITAERRSPPEPRLMSPQIAQEFSILKLDLKLGALSQAELVHSLEKASIASLLDGKISQSVKHLLSLRDRIEDISSKVLITGDLNAGKSTFCNALLRRKVLPEDQQPCTSIFCEVLDARENGGLEEVHAVHKDRQYNRNDETTYDVYSLNQLEDIVVDNSKYMQCKVYVKDVRTIDESLLNNGVVDIALIDAPGLNSDSLKTTAVFARQEEIDVVVFVVSAANHFTLSAQDFIWNAAHEKAYMFIVVNGFDQIRDKQRCQRMILDQIKKLSPRTYKEAAELVHFVSSNAVPVAPQIPVGGPGGGGGGGGGSDPNGNDWPGAGDDDDGKPEDKGKGKGKEKEKIQDFETLEGSLRRFVLEKRSRSKLAPARTYLLNLLADINALASVNREVADAELQSVVQELAELEPAYENGKKKKVELQEQVDKCIDDSCDDVYNHTRSTLSSAISNVSEANLGVDYPGIFSAFQYAEDLKFAMLEHISASVTTCEDYARAKTAQGVGFIQNIGLLHIGEDKFTPLNFRADMMFRRGRRHALARQVNTEVELLDFFDIAGIWERQEKIAGTGMAMTAVTILGGRAFGGISWVDSMFSAAKFLGPNNLRRLFLPGIVAAAVLTTAYVLSTIPQTLPPRLSRKIAATLSEMDYVHSNSTRISTEVRRILRMPAGNLQNSLAQDIEDLGRRKQEVSKTKQESEVASKYFANLYRDSSENRNSVENIDLDGPLPGGLGAYDA